MRQHPARNQPLGRCIGLVAVAAEAAPQLAAVRLAAGLRWTGALRSAVVLERLSWAGAEGELIGGRAAWQGYRANSFSAGMLGTGARGATDYGIQVGANLLTGDSDPYRNVNILESGMSALGLRPAVIGFGSAAINLNSRGYLKTVFHPDHDHRVYPASFFAQALLGTVIGSSGSALEARLLERGSRSAAVGLYMHVVLRQPRLAYPLGLGLYHLGSKGVPTLIGVLEETSEGTADNLLTPPPTSESHNLQP